MQFLPLLTWKCASRHNGVHFFHSSTSKSGPSMDCFVHFYFQNVMGATTACTFSTSQLPKIVRDRRALPLLTPKCASRHNGVHFFIYHLPRCLRTSLLSEPTFQPSGAIKHRKNTVFRDFPTFSRTCIFSLLTFSISDLLPSDFLHVRVSSWLCFFLAVLFICPYCRNFSF